MIRASINVESEDLSLEELTASIGQEPDEGFRRGQPSKVNAARKLARSTWAMHLDLPDSQHAGTEGLSMSLGDLSIDLADRLGALSQRGCDVVFAVVQEIEGSSDQASKGLHLDEDGIRWLARARASFVLDQYWLDAGFESGSASSDSDGSMP